MRHVDSLKDLAEIAGNFLPDFSTVELAEDVDGRPHVRIWMAGDDLEQYTIIQEKRTLPAWATIVGVDVMTGENLPELIDTDSAVCVYIEDKREQPDTIESLIVSGLSPSEAIDYWAVETCEYTQTEWAKQRSVGQGSVSENISKARKKLNG